MDNATPTVSQWGCSLRDGRYTAPDQLCAVLTMLVHCRRTWKRSKSCPVSQKQYLVRGFLWYTRCKPNSVFLLKKDPVQKKQKQKIERENERKKKTEFFKRQLWSTRQTLLTLKKRQNTDFFGLIRRLKTCYKDFLINLAFHVKW